MLKQIHLEQKILNKKYPRFKKAFVIWYNRKRNLRWVTLKFRPLDDEMLDGGGHGCKVPTV